MGTDLSEEKIAQIQIEAKNKKVATAVMRLLVTGGYEALIVGLRADK